MNYSLISQKKLLATKKWYIMQQIQVFIWVTTHSS